MSKEKCRLYHFLSTFVMLGLFLFYISLAYIIGTGNTVFVRKDMLLDDIMIGVILTGCIGLIAAIALCFGGYKETWKINWIGDALLILAALIQFGFGISAVYHYSHAGDDAEVLWDNAPGHVQEAWIQAFSCDIDNIDSCKNSMAQYLKEGYVPFIILFFLSGILCMISAFISFFWIRHLHESKPSPKCASKEAFEVLVLR